MRYLLILLFLFGCATSDQSDVVEKRCIQGEVWYYYLDPETLQEHMWPKLKDGKKVRCIDERRERERQRRDRERRERHRFNRR